MHNLVFIIYIISAACFAQSSYQLAVLKYQGGGDWYSNPSSLKNLAIFCNDNLNMNIEEDYAIVEPNNQNIFDYPYIYMTGHGNVIFSKSDIENLRNYLKGGGFLHIDDNYGMNQYIRSEMQKVFPELNFIELPHNHPIYHNIYKFSNGLPKIHEHDNKPAQGFALIYNNKVICYYSYESDLGDGWEDAGMHGNPEHIREKAFKMGANIISYAMNPKK
tara:strand:- start:804 stop:1457 length:654 start_codon:yes stop_codon:yes gene_type:complete